jgi:hypothetical protein
MPFLDLPPSLQERVVRSISAAIKYKTPANIVLAIAEKEASKHGQWVRNSDGSYDVGILQFNTTYLAGLSQYGITPNDVTGGGCYSFDLPAWGAALGMEPNRTVVQEIVYSRFSGFGEKFLPGDRIAQVRNATGKAGDKTCELYN